MKQLRGEAINLEPGRFGAHDLSNRMGRRVFSATAADNLLRHDPATAVSTTASDLPDLDEEDVWAAITYTSSGKNRWRHHVGCLSRALDGGAAVAISSPLAVSLPEWARTGLGRVGTAEPVGGYAGEEEEDEGEWIPPHEYLAREQGKTALATSVFEGVGRTLKGRDMSRVRNAFWNQTGFFG